MDLQTYVEYSVGPHWVMIERKYFPPRIVSECPDPSVLNYFRHACKFKMPSQKTTNTAKCV